MDEREIIGMVENHNQAIVGNEYKKGVKPNGITPAKSLIYLFLFTFYSKQNHWN